MDALQSRVVLFLLYCVTAAAFSTYLIEERAHVCFYKYVDRKTSLHAKVFVLKGGTKLDVGFSVHGPINRDPEGNVLKSRSKSEVRHVAKIASEGFLGDDEKFSGYEYKFDAGTGEYEICLSNDRIFEQVAKHVMLDISEVVEDDAGGSNAKALTDPQDAGETQTQKDLTVITTGVDELKGVFAEIKKLQQLERMRLTQRKTAAANNHGSMVQSSVIETMVLLLVGIGQIIFVRKWFSGKGTLLKQWT
ncbi:unnamed protein product [Pylaiella littoralis]